MEYKNVDTLKANREILLNYANQLVQLKNKMTFGKDETSVKIEFKWTDTFKESKWTSYSIHFEYYNIIFNLAMINYILGVETTSEQKLEEFVLKDGIKYYQYAAGFFNLIKEEAPSVINQKDLPYDMDPNYMTYCVHICTALAQILLLEVAGRKKTANNLQASLAKGVENCFKSAYTLLTQSSFRKYIDDIWKYLVENRCNYYEAKTFEKMRDYSLDQFNNTGKDYGVAITYQGGVVLSLNKNAKSNKKVEKLLKRDNLNAQEAQALGEQMYEKNSKIYYHKVPELEELPEVSQKIMANPALPPEFNTKEENKPELNSLVPRQVKEMIGEYKGKMMDFITQNLNKYENESTIGDFLKQLNLPGALEAVMSTCEISDSLWRKVYSIQEKGGLVFLNNQVQTLSKKPFDIQKRIDDTLVLLQNEQDEDLRLRKQYASKWTRKNSFELNGNYVMTLNDYKRKLDQAKMCDQRTLGDIQNNQKNFELLTLPRQKLNEKIPKKGDNEVKNCKEATELRSQLDELDKLQGKCMEKIQSIFTMLNEDNVTSQFIQVVNKKTTENAVFEGNKAKFMSIFSELQTLSNEVNAKKTEVKAKNEAFVKVKNEKLKPDIQNEQFFSNLDNYVRLFQEKSVQLNQGINFYKQFDNKLSEVNRHVTDFLMARDMEKNQLIQG
ncbi:MAG: hypothetical protein MJ252_14735, partial [archaeon]|nr:hypothetical protein [archaeon]